MRRHLSASIRAELGMMADQISAALFDRSSQVWKTGVRSRQKDLPVGVWPVSFLGRKLTGELLVSGYAGGELVVITTEETQWLVGVEEIGNGSALRANGPTSGLLAVEVEKPDSKAPDAPHRHGGIDYV